MVDLLGDGRFRLTRRSRRTFCDIAGTPPPPVIPIVSEQIVTDIENRDQGFDPIAITNPVKAGSLLVLTYNAWRALVVGGVTSITDTQGNFWQKAVNADLEIPGDAAWITSQIWYAENCNPGVTIVTPVVPPGTSLFYSAAIQEISGIRPSGSLDTTGFNAQEFGTGEATVTADAVSSQGNTLVVGVADQDGLGNIPWTIPPGYTEVYDAPNGDADEPGHSDYKIEAVAQLESITWIRNAFFRSANAIAVFKGFL